MSRFRFLLFFFLFSSLIFVSSVRGECPVNSVPFPGRGCAACGPGEVSPGGTEPNCTPCGPGTRAGRGSCDPCPIGTFSPVAQSETCLVCPTGKIAPSQGMTQCVDCPPGQYAAGASECKPCPLGHRFSNGSCAACPAGSARQSQDTECVLCAPGSYSSSQGSSACSVCEIGRFAPDPGSVSCSFCPAGSSSTPQFNVSFPCVQCSLGKTTTGQGGECVNDDQTSKHRLSEGAAISYSYALGSIFLFIAVLGFLGQRWIDRIQNREAASGVL